MPKAMAPSAPCVEVWLSPQAIVMPGCVSPSSGPMTWTMPWFVARRAPTELDAELAAVALERRHHLLGHHVEERPRLRRWSARCDRRWRRCARETRPSSRAAAACRTPAGSSLRGRGAGRRTAASVRSAACGRCARPRLSEKVLQPCAAARRLRVDASSRRLMRSRAPARIHACVSFALASRCRRTRRRGGSFAPARADDAGRSRLGIGRRRIAGGGSSASHGRDRRRRAVAELAEAPVRSQASRFAATCRRGAAPRYRRAASS